MAAYYAFVSAKHPSSASTAAGILIALVLGVLGNIAMEQAASIPPYLAWILTALVTVGAIAVNFWSERSAKQTAENSQLAFDAVAEHAVAALENSLPTPEKSLEDEISEVSESLSQTVARLRQVSDKAQAFEVEVKQLVARADAARATAKLHEDDARRIALFLGSETEQRIRSEIDTLRAEHERQINVLRRSGTRMALWTFVGGVVLGVIGNVVVALLMGS